MDECSDAVIISDVFLVADILIAVVDREIEVSSGAPKVVEVRAIPQVGRPGRRAQRPRLCQEAHREQQ